MKPFFVYMLECSDRSLYVGHTDDLEIRIAQHESGALGGHTSTRRPVRLVWCAEMESREEALGCELQLKGWSRAKKRALIEGDWERLRELAAPRTGPDLRRGRPIPARPEPVEGRGAGSEERSSFDKLRTNGRGGERSSSDGLRSDGHELTNRGTRWGRENG